MKVKFALAVILAFSMVSCVGASFMPDEGTFAFREVEVHDINGVNFTVPTDFEITLKLPRLVEVVDF